MYILKIDFKFIKLTKINNNLIKILSKLTKINNFRNIKINGIFKTKKKKKKFTLLK